VNQPPGRKGLTCYFEEESHDDLRMVAGIKQSAMSAVIEAIWEDWRKRNRAALEKARAALEVKFHP
jgi:hypothetical protein